MVLDRDERIRYINWTVPDLTVEQVIGTEPYDYVPDEHKASLRASYRSVLETGEPSRVETRYAAEDGSQSAWETRAVPLRHGGEIDGIVIVSTNISERDAAAAKLRQSQKMELVGQLAGGIAHDFNNLLLAVLLNNELAARAAEDPLVTERLDESKMAIERAVELTRQLLTFGRRQPVRFENLDLNVLVCNMIKILSRTLPETIALRFEPTDDAAIVRADCGQIEQILLNLCINARDAIDKTGTIRIATARMARNDGDGDRTEIRLSITDDGKGMAPEGSRWCTASWKNTAARSPSRASRTRAPRFTSSFPPPRAKSPLWSKPPPARWSPGAAAARRSSWPRTRRTCSASSCSCSKTAATGWSPPATAARPSSACASSATGLPSRCSTS
jgi:PAS domain S-box-containing protein